MAADKKLEVEMGFDDKYTNNAEEAAKSTDKLDKTLQKTEKTTLEANIAFQTTLETIDQVGGSFAKIRAGAEDLNIVNEEQAETLRKVEGAADLFTGTATLAIVASRGWALANVQLRTSLIGVGFGAAAVGTAMLAVNSASTQQQAIFSTLTGITTALAIAQFLRASGLFAAQVTGAGLAAPVMVAVVGGALAAAATFMAAQKSQAGLQTGVGEAKDFEVSATGNVEVHAGEQGRITRGGGVPSLLRERSQGRGAPIIGQLTIVNAFDPFDPNGQRRIADQIGNAIVSRVRGLKA